MTWQAGFYTYSLVLSGAVCLIAAIFALTRSRTPSGVRFVYLMICLAWWSLTQAWEVSVVQPSVKLLAAKALYLAVVSVAPLWFFFAAGFQKNQRHVLDWRGILLWLIPVFVLAMAMTNESHGLVWPKITPAADRPGALLIYEHGPVVWLNLIYSYALILVGTFFILRTALRSGDYYRRQLRWLIPGILSPWIGNILYMFKIGSPGLDYTPYAFVLSGLLFGHALFRFGLQEIVPVAKDTLLAGLSDAVLILDGDNRVVDINPAGQKLFGRREQVLGLNLPQLLAPWPDLAVLAAKTLKGREETLMCWPMGERWLDLRMSFLHDSSGRKTGRLIVIHDITDVRRAEEELRAKDLLLEAVTAETLKLSAAVDIDTAVLETLARLGRLLGVSRAYLFENSRTPETGVLAAWPRFEWAEEGVPPLFQTLGAQALLYSGTGLSAWRQRFEAGKEVAGLTRDFSGNERRLMVAWGVRSILAVPVLQAGQLWGFLAFDECRSERPWEAAEIAALKQAATAVGDAIIRHKAELALRASEERFRMLVESAPDPVFVQTEGVFRYVNAATVALLGASSPIDLLGKPILDFVHPLHRAATADRIRTTNEERRSVPRIELVYRRIDGSDIDVEIAVVPVDFERRPGGLAFVRDISERKQNEREREAAFSRARAQEQGIIKIAVSAATAGGDFREAAAEIDEIAAAALRAERAGVWIFNAARGLLECVDQFERTVARHSFGQTLQMAEFPRYFEALQTERVIQADDAFADPRTREFERTYLAPLGIASILDAPIRSGGRMIGVVCLEHTGTRRAWLPDEVRFVGEIADQAGHAWMNAERRRGEEALRDSLREKELLLKEIHHRVRNNMQIISSLLNHQARLIRDSSVVDMFRESQNRIRSMALVHEKLYRSSDLSRIDFSDYIRSLLAYLLQTIPVGADRIHVRPEMEPVEIDINTSIPLGLIVNELIMNAFKHAFPGGRNGEVVIRLEKRPEGDFRLVVGDNGVGLPPGLDIRNASSLGMRIITMLAEQLNARLSAVPGPGTTFELVFRELPYKSRL